MRTSKINSSIHGLPVLKDNIIWIWVHSDNAVVVDPAVAKPVQDWIQDKQLKLEAILHTHHHHDHIGGTKGLLNYWPEAKVIASKDDLDRIPLQTLSVKDGQKLSIMGFPVNVLEVPGHTSTHLAYFIPNIKSKRKSPVLFCGDTLFAGGCGRLFEGSPQEMYQSLNRINELPIDTEVYCAHEYTQSNLEWAASLYPNDELIRRRLSEVIELRKIGICSLPTTIKEEQKTNLFIRAKGLEEFKDLRLNKDSW